MFDNIISAIVGGIIGIIGTYMGSVRLSRINNKHLAGLRLREAFSIELSALQFSESKTEHEIITILESSFNKHYMAINEFRFFLNRCSLLSFNKAWDEYYKNPIGGNPPDFSQYMGDINLALTRINKILEFTK